MGYPTRSLLAGWVSRTVIVLALCLGSAAAQSQSPEEELVSLRQQLASAAQSGDAKAVLRLSAAIEAVEERIAARVERITARAESEKFSSEVQTLLKAYRRQMADAAAAGDTARVTKLAEAITRLEASAPVTPEMLEGNWVLDSVLQNGVESNRSDVEFKNKSVFIFDEGQRFRREIRVFLRTDSQPFEQPVCGIDPVVIDKEDLSDSTHKPVVVVGGRYELERRQVHISTPWGGILEEWPDVVDNFRSRTLILREDGKLSLRFWLSYGVTEFWTYRSEYEEETFKKAKEDPTFWRAAGTSPLACELVFRRVDVPENLGGPRIDARQIAIPPAEWEAEGDVCSSERYSRTILYALEHQLTNDSPYWFSNEEMRVQYLGSRYLVDVAAHYCPVRSRIESAGWGDRVSFHGSLMAARPVKWAFSQIG